MALYVATHGTTSFFFQSTLLENASLIVLCSPTYKSNAYLYKGSFEIEFNRNEGDSFLSYF